MNSAISMKKRSKLSAAPFAPMLFLVFAVGWILYWIGQFGQLKAKHPQKTINKMSINQDKFDLVGISD